MCATLVIDTKFRNENFFQKRSFKNENRYGLAESCQIAEHKKKLRRRGSQGFQIEMSTTRKEGTHVNEGFVINAKNER